MIHENWLKNNIKSNDKKNLQEIKNGIELSRGLKQKDRISVVREYIITTRFRFKFGNI